MRSKNFVSGIEVGRAHMLATGQATVYAARDDADILAGIPKPTARYQINTTGPFTNTTPVYLPTLARNDIAFVNATSKITAAAGLDVVKTGDVIRIRGSAGNDTEYTVATGNVAAEIVLTAAPVEEAAGAWITIAKQALQSNNTVLDLNTGLLWLRYGSYSPAKLGAASDGKLLWTATAVTIHAANTDIYLSSATKGTATVVIKGGAAEIAKYWPGYSYSFGFAGAINKLPGFRCTAVATSGAGLADLSITLNTGNLTCVAEGSDGSPVNGAINLSCNGMFGFANACIAAGVGGYSDWRVSNVFELFNLCNEETALPDATTFPLWAPSQSSTTYKAPANCLTFEGDIQYVRSKTAEPGYTMLIRGGI